MVGVYRRSEPPGRERREPMNVKPKQIMEMEKASKTAKPMQMDSSAASKNPTSPVGSTGLVARKRTQPLTVDEWLEREPEWDDACKYLIRLIRNSEPHSDLLKVAEYIECFFEEQDPVAMGWVGSDGRQ